MQGDLLAAPLQPWERGWARVGAAGSGSQEVTSTCDTHIPTEFTVTLADSHFLTHWTLSLTHTHTHSHAPCSPSPRKARAAPFCSPAGTASHMQHLSLCHPEEGDRNTTPTSAGHQDLPSQLRTPTATSRLQPAIARTLPSDDPRLACDSRMQ